jgi:uncharacterized membrane protein YgcG
VSRCLALLALLLGLPAAAFCPCYTRTSTANTLDCGVDAAPGTNPTLAQWQAIFALVSGGPAAWGSSGPAVGALGQGCGKPMPPTSTPARFPCELLKAITYQESGWRQFCVPDRPADQVGGVARTIISFDCGYGVGQVTSGMHVGEAPSFDRARVASDATYNLATGTQILAEKWRVTNCVGDNQPDLIEHWYSATWAYNGLSAANNPNNANFSTTRGVWRPSVGGSAPYQEKVFGWMEFPPSSAHWNSVPFAYPRLSEVGSGRSPPSLSEPSCGSPTSCISVRATHRSACVPSDAGTADGGLAADAGVPMDAGAGAGAGAGGGSATGGGSAVAGGSATGGGAASGGGASTGGGVEEPVEGGEVVGAKSGCTCGASDGLAGVALMALLRLRRLRPARRGASFGE